MGWIVVLIIFVIILAIWLGRKKKPLERSPSQLTTTEARRGAVAMQSKTHKLLQRRYTKKNEQSRESSKTYVRYDWQRIHEKSIRTVFPDEWSPALPYLFEAYELEKAGADQQKIQEMLEKARQADSNATSFYMARRSIIKKMQNANHDTAF